MDQSNKQHGFTLIELLVVVAIIAMLIAILMPALQKARDHARRVQCAAQQKQIVIAAFAYANDFMGMMPRRGAMSATTLPHVTHGSDYDLNKTFYSRYLPVRIVTVSGKTQRRDDEILFCPGPLLSVRYPGLVSPEYRYDFISYQYFVMPDRTANGTNTANWKHERNGQQFQPNLASLQSIPPGRWGIYSCMTLSRTPTTNTTWLGHDAPETRAAPTGMNAAFADGSAGWVALSDTEAYWQQSPTSQQWYWPKPQD